MHYAYILPINPLKDILRAEIAAQTAEYLTRREIETLSGMNYKPLLETPRRKPGPEETCPRAKTKSAQGKNESDTNCPSGHITLKEAHRVCVAGGYKGEYESFRQLNKQGGGPSIGHIHKSKCGRKNYMYFTVAACEQWIADRKEPA